MDSEKKTPTIVIVRPRNSGKSYTEHIERLRQAFVKCGYAADEVAFAFKSFEQSCNKLVTGDELRGLHDDLSGFVIEDDYFGAPHSNKRYNIGKGGKRRRRKEGRW